MSKPDYLINPVKILISAAAVLFFVNGQQAFAESYTKDELNTINVYEDVSPSIVSVDVDIDDGVSSGTGIVIESSGTILTSGHVIEGYKKNQSNFIKR